MNDERLQSDAPAALVRSIRRLTAAVRGNGTVYQESESGWWVLAVGEPFGKSRFQERDEARDRLRQSVNQCGVELAEYVWVWDRTDRAQLVLATLPTRRRAEQVAERYRARGLSVRVTEADPA